MKKPIRVDVFFLKWATISKKTSHCIAFKQNCITKAVLDDKKPEIPEKTEKCTFLVDFKAIRNPISRHLL